MTAQDTPAATPAALAAIRAGRLFRAVAVAEACSWAGLLIGMLFKYVLIGNQIGVQVFGPIHGAMFVAYVVVTIWAGRALRWPASTLVVALLCGIPPLATLWFERRARRSGRLVPATG